MKNKALHLASFLQNATAESARVFLKCVESRPDYRAKIDALSTSCYHHIKFTKPAALDNNPDLIKDAVFFHEHSLHPPQFWLRFSHLTGLQEYCEHSIRRETIMYTAKHKEELAAKAADKANKKSLAHFVCAHHLASIAEIVVYAAERAALDQGCRNSISELLAEEKSASAKARKLHEFFVERMGLHLATMVDEQIKNMLAQETASNAIIVAEQTQATP